MAGDTSQSQQLRSMEKRKEIGKGIGTLRSAASGWSEGATVDPALDLAWCQNANGGNLGVGNPGTPRNGKRAHDGSRSPRVRKR